MKKNLFIALIAAAAIAPVAAQAQYYAGASVGRADQKLTIEHVGSVKDNDTSYKLFGGYQYNKNIGVEAAYVDMGTPTLNADSDQLSAKPRSISLAATGTVPLSNGFALTGKVGFARTSTKVSVTGAGEETIRHTSPLLGIGATYAITPAIQIVAEYENYFNIINKDGAKLKAQTLSAGVRYNF